MIPRDRALLAVVRRKEPHSRSLEEISAELSELTRSAGGAIVGEVSAAIEKPAPNLFIHIGKVNEVRALARERNANVVILSVDLSPAQARNLEREIGVRVVDRTGLILDIFARRAQSRAGRLQVELAQLNYLLPRLVGHGVLMSRLGGGIGTRGPGEQKLEIDRRTIRDRIGRLKGELEKLRSHHHLIQTRRKRQAFPVVSIVGYTNSGKSTLLNALTGSDVFVEDKLFATLDPTTRGFRTSSGSEILFTDTVGFLIDLPHILIEAFRATLEEVTESDALIHVLDAASPYLDDQHASVCEVLKEIGAGGKPAALALNKIDLLEESELKRISEKYPLGILISAKERKHLDRLADQVVTVLETARCQQKCHSEAQPKNLCS